MWHFCVKQGKGMQRILKKCGQASRLHKYTKMAFLRSNSTCILHTAVKS